MIAKIIYFVIDFVSKKKKMNGKRIASISGRIESDF